MAPPPSGLSEGRAVVFLARAGGSGVAGTLATSSLARALWCHQGSDLGRSEVLKKIENRRWLHVVAHLVLLHIRGLQLHLLGWGGRGKGWIREGGGAGGVHWGGGQHPLPGAPIEHGLITEYEEERQRTGFTLTSSQACTTSSGGSPSSRMCRLHELKLAASGWIYFPPSANR